MTIAQNLHPVRLKAPFFQNGERASLHRYLDADFVNRFRQDVQRQQFQQPQFNQWLEDERHSRHGNEPVLRLPLHRAFHIVCCEVVCDRPGQPALDPQKITSAGFVIRKIGNGREQAWMLEDGEALGWQDAPAALRDPDIHRRLCASGVLHKRTDDPAYSGEEVHPLHILKTEITQKESTRKDGKKTHTLLFGYVPLGGFHFHREPSAAFDPQAQTDAENAAAQALSWPFGFRTARQLNWTRNLATPVDQGRPTKQMFELLRLLVNRYHLGEANIADNAALEKYCAGLWFIDTGILPDLLRHAQYDEGNHGLFAAHKSSTSLFSYLQACFAQQENNPLVPWLIRQEKRIDAAGGIDSFNGPYDPLPAPSGTGTLALSLFLLQADCDEIRTLLGQRVRAQALALVKEIPLPKFTQNANDLYQIVPFVRSLNEHGREQIQWAEPASRSILFRVAAPFDPEASRPSMIQMPSLSDLKRGLAKGVAMITPGDTFNLMNSIKFNKGISEDALPAEEPKPGLDIQWICSFSLPVVTLIAMLILMIMISLLNIIFFWMPWVRICLPFPKMK